MHVRRRVLSRLVAGATASLMAAFPLSAAAADPGVDALWSQPGGISIDSPLYPLQSWWNSWNQQVPNDPTQRGLAELNQANIDLLNAYTLLEKAHGPGPDPVPVLDPMLSTVYDAITGSSARAPLGSLGSWVSHSLLQLEGREATSQLVAGLLQDYRDKQAVAVRDLHATGGPQADALLQANAAREADFLDRVAAISSPEDGIATLLADASSQTKALSAHGRDLALTHSSGNGKSGNAQSNGGGPSHGQGKSSDGGKGTNDKNPKKK